MDQRTVALLSSHDGLNILKRKKSAGSMVLRNQQTDAPNFVKLFYEKASFCEEIPRTKGALGYTMQVEENEQNLLSKEEAFQKIMVYTGGRCAEELIFNSITSGASNDIEQATKLARAMITRLGMSDEFGMTALETVNNQYLGGDTSLACSNETATKIDEATIALIKKAHDEAYQILEDNKMKLHELAKFLYERETITGEEFMYILNKPAEIPAQTNKD